MEMASCFRWVPEEVESFQRTDLAGRRSHLSRVGRSNVDIRCLAKVRSSRPLPVVNSQAGKAGSRSSGAEQSRTEKRFEVAG